MSSESVNTRAFINSIIFVTHKTNTRKIQNTKTHLKETMAAEKTGTTEVHVLTYFQNIC